MGEIEELKRARAGFMQQLQALLEQHRSILEHMRGDAPVSEPPPAADNVSFLAPPVSKKK